MKILLMAAALFVVLILAVVLTGLLLPKRHVVSRSASYHATPEQLFAFIAGPQNWRPEVLRSETLTDAAGHQILRETSRRGETLTYELVACVPLKTLTRRIATQNLPYSGAWTYSLEPDNGLTTVRITEDGEVYNPFFRFMSRFVLGYTGTMDAYLRALGKATGQDIQVHD